MDDMYDSYTCDGINQIYFCLRHGFEDVKPVACENSPLDEYGLSMLSIIVNEEGEARPAGFYSTGELHQQKEWFSCYKD